ncbi:gamma-glutamylcyclotransferase [Drosophila busckii]|uniref:gamma-glutamylcyclotransferase n=1 Tax=Drosophila busckii TaxID=30019 RepID=UPI00143318C0|nr:gamma-glutamylcyclotransferase [Drosophila busckii]
MANKFYYFGFGSNMLARRIHIQNPTAKRIGAGKLENYRLDFQGIGSSRWLGAPATIVPTPGSHVYGAVWEIDMCNLSDLDNQEGVSDGIYIPISVAVQTLHDNSQLECRAYHLSTQPESDLHAAGALNIPHNRQPSKSYLKVLVKGAEETGVPQEYLKWLKGLKHNDNYVEDMEQILQLEQVKLDQ